MTQVRWQCHLAKCLLFGPLFRQALKNRKRKAPPRTWTSVKAAEMLTAVTPEGSPGRENYDLGIPYSLFIASDEMTHCLPNLQTS